MAKEKKFYLQKGNRYLATGDTFAAPTMGDENAVAFDSEDAALDKAGAAPAETAKARASVTYMRGDRAAARRRRRTARGFRR